MNEKKKICARDKWLIGIACLIVFILGTVFFYENFSDVLFYIGDENKSNIVDDTKTEQKSEENEDSNKPLDNDVEEAPEMYAHFVDMTQLEINYVTELDNYNCEIDSNGFLQGNCAVDELKNKRFVNLAEGNDEFVGNILALGVDGFVYDIGFEDAEKGIMTLNKKFKPLENITGMGFIRYNTTECVWLIIPIYVIDSKEYIIDLASDDWENAKYILLEDAKKNNLAISSVWACGYFGDEIFIDTTISISKNLILTNGKIVKDGETKNNIEVKYSVYQFINGKESLHIISDDNKYYVLDEETEYVNAEDTIKNIHLQDKYLTLSFEDGRMTVLILYN